MNRSSLALFNGKVYLENRRTMVLGLSPGNPHYYKDDTLRSLCQLAESRADKVLLFIPDKILEHNYKAVGSKNPETSARVKSNRLRNKCKEVMQSIGCQAEKFTFISWTTQVQSNPYYDKAYQCIRELYLKNDQFRVEIQESTRAALTCMTNGRESGQQDSSNETFIDINEGVIYILKELAFLDALQHIYENCQEYVFVYHREWPILEKYFDGFYDGISRSSLGFLVFSQEGNING
ncbi:uncharacterized protein LOC110253722 [Exaiptasia diaphana]|uniref:Cyclodipeptide synthase n=1 Tax=Exaiptasia diaphana TaxID=2652724 RepID=A0A913Y7E9_EXADI|nr:uncharacterized protein LOC110253722 [Exaiptasia diaphana]KXJ06569.1 Cyclo(L-leucyl-L-leucyl) synthase [Exaiptasia diaphana]